MLICRLSKVRCPVCKAKNIPNKDCNTGKKHVQKYGSFRRKSDSKRIQRYKCLLCNNTFSTACKDPAYRQKKRRLNHKIKILSSSHCSMRRIAIMLNTTRVTVARKCEFLGKKAMIEHTKLMKNKIYKEKEIQFDELQTIEHTNCKPLAVAVAVAKKSRKILGFSVSKMPPPVYLAKISLKKYGNRPDCRPEGLKLLFKQLTPIIDANTIIHFDKHSYYKPLIKQYFPKVAYIQSNSDKSSIAGQGILKKQYKDPLFTVNHTLAMMRANINRLIHKTWCTTKDPTRLVYHLAIYMSVHNSYLT